MINRRLLAIAACALVMLAGAASAHHGWGGYDASTVRKLTGVIEQAVLENPHGLLRLKVSSPDGKVWTVTLSPPSRMVNRGLPLEKLKVGTTVSVTGYPSKLDPNEMRAENITVDGTTTELR